MLDIDVNHSSHLMIVTRPQIDIVLVNIKRVFVVKIGLVKHRSIMVHVVV